MIVNLIDYMHNNSAVYTTVYVLLTTRSYQSVIFTIEIK